MGGAWGVRKVGALQGGRGEGEGEGLEEWKGIRAIFRVFEAEDCMSG